MSDVNASLGGGVGTTLVRIASLNGLITSGLPLGTVNGFDVSDFDNAVSTIDRISAFLAVLNQSPGVPGLRILLPDSAAYDSLRAVLAQLNHD